MKRLRAIFLLLVYSACSWAALGSVSIIPESPSEGTEKEVINSSAFEHREGSYIRLAGKLYSSSIERNTYGNAPLAGIVANDVFTNNFSFAGLAVPAYILYCVYRL